MTPLLLHILSVQAFLTALVAFGFAPGLVLRIIVLAFERSDPRRRELMAELYNVPRLERPFWVADQIEVALSEGLVPRLVKIVKRWNLGHRLVRWWRNFWHEFWHGKSADTLASYFASLALFGSGIYLYMLLPGISRYLALALWFALLETRAVCLQRYRKRRERAGEPIYTARVDRVIFVTLGPAVYVTTAYMLIHDLITLISGNLAPSYWMGIYICIGIMSHPWHEIRVSRWVQQIESKPALEQESACKYSEVL
jgi:hypothetical protein